MADLAAALSRILGDELAALRWWEPAVRRDDEDAVHRMRVAARTVRSVLQVFSPLFEKEPRTQTNRRLRDLGRLLAPARDAEVLRDLVDQRLAALPGGADGEVAALVPQVLAHRLRAGKETEYRQAHREILRVMDTEGYAEDLARIEAFARQLPLSSDLDDELLRDPAAALTSAATAHVDVVIDLGERAATAGSPGSELELLHETRKAAKQLRYALRSIERSTEIVFGDQVARQADAATTLQDALGAHRDSVMFQRYLLHTAREAAADGQDTFGLGLLHGRELHIQRKAHRKGRRRLEDLRRSR